MLESLEWPQWVRVREILIALREFGFTSVPHAERTSLTTVFQGQDASAIIEDAMGLLRLVEEQSPNAIMTCQLAWRALQASPLAEDADLKPVRVTPATKAGVARVYW